VSRYLNISPGYELPLKAISSNFRYATLEHTRINTYAHLYTWNPPSSAFNPALKPIVLMAHQDVVPVNPTTENEWDQAPFGGVIDTEGGWVWGRGAADCKNQVS
jgi:acetylornithine deacetylase/succinyl-diaminopimelate desuccinylase-like protein